jgi:type VI secretion system secreted protein Hcp
MTRMPMLTEAARAVLVTGIYLTLGPAAQGQPPTRAEPVVDIFLRVDGIAGEATDSGHAGWIDVDSFSYSISRPAGTSETATHQGLTLVKHVDKASPFLYLHCSSGRPLDKMVLEITRTADDDVSIQEFRLHNATVTSVQASAGTGDKRATERVTLHYESIAWTYVRVDPITGSVISEVTMQWDLTDGDDS